MEVNCGDTVLYRSIDCHKKINVSLCEIRRLARFVPDGQTHADTQQTSQSMSSLLQSHAVKIICSLSELVSLTSI